MIRNGVLSSKAFIVTMGLAFGLTTARAQDVKWYDAVTLGGHIQGSYQYNLGKPKTGAGAPTGNQARVFDTGQEDDFAINQAQLKLSKALGDDGYGFTAKLLFGEDARALNLAGSDNSVYVEEAYGIFAVPRVKGLTVTGGRFVTMEGVEVIETPLNPNITGGLLFGFAEPFVHTGVKANYVLCDKLNVTAGVVNGWENIVDSSLDNNRGKTLLGNINVSPMSGLMANVHVLHGPEVLATNHSKRTSLDLVLGYTGIEKLGLFVQGNWGQDTNLNIPVAGGVHDGTLGTSDVPWKGAGVWATYAANSWLNPAVRFEVFDDQHGANRFALGTNQTIKNVTFTNKFQVAKNMFIRGEYRHDWSNVGVFQNKLGNTVRVQNTVGADWVVTF